MQSGSVSSLLLSRLLPSLLLPVLSEDGPDVDVLDGHVSLDGPVRSANRSGSDKPRGRKVNPPAHSRARVWVISVEGRRVGGRAVFRLREY